MDGPAERDVASRRRTSSRVEHADLGEFVLRCAGKPVLLFTENETNNEQGSANPSAYVKDALHLYVAGGNRGTVNPDRTGTKPAGPYILEVPPAGSRVVLVRLWPPDAQRVERDDAEQLFAGRSKCTRSAYEWNSPT